MNLCGNFEREISEWSISKDKKLCEKLDHHAINNVLVSQIKEIIIPWEIFQEILKFPDSSISYELTDKNVGGEVVIEMNAAGGCACDTCLGVRIFFIEDCL